MSVPQKDLIACEETLRGLLRDAKTLEQRTALRVAIMVVPEKRNGGQ